MQGSTFGNLEYHVRISILLQEQLQNEDGTLIYYQRWGCYINKPIGTVEYPLKGTLVQEKLGPFDQEWKPMRGKDFSEWQSELGLNVYEGYVPIKSSTVIELSKPTTKLIMEKTTTINNEDLREVDRTLSTLILGSKVKHNQ